MADPRVVREKAESFFELKLQHEEIKALHAERIKIYAPFIQAGDLMALVATDHEGVLREFLFTLSDNKIEFPTVSCLITYEDVPLGDCPEYCFKDAPEWKLALLADVALDHFRQKKFKLWEQQLKEPECEAAFRRLLQQGPIRNVYDKFIFPSPEQVAANYKVKDEHSGKLVDIPHQVSCMRRWNPKTERYQDVDCSLVGAPASDIQANQYWQHMLQELRQLRGTEYIDSLLGSHSH
jgi:hypothetical protein